MAPEQTFFVSWPISTNDLWRAVKGRNILSAKARAWKATAEKELMVQKARPIKGPVRLCIALSSPYPGRAYDPDNRIKALLDLLVGMHVIEDDNNLIIKHLSVQVDEGFAGAKITVTPLLAVAAEQAEAA